MSVIESGIKFTQVSNGHVIGVRGGRIVFHAEQSKTMSEDELREYAKNAVELLEEIQHGHTDSEKAMDRPHS